MNQELQRQLARLVKQLIWLASSQIGDVRDKHECLKEADYLLIRAVSKIEEYLRATE